MIAQFAAWLDATALATMIRETNALFPWLEAVHVMAISIVFGTILLVDLRLMGLASRSYRASRLIETILPITWVAFVLALITGSLLFTSQPLKYLQNTFFVTKMALIASAGVNMAFFHLITHRTIGDWDDSPTPPVAARFAGATSVALWLAIIACGRWIGFTMGF